MTKRKFEKFLVFVKIYFYKLVKPAGLQPAVVKFIC